MPGYAGGLAERPRSHPGQFFHDLVGQTGQDRVIDIVRQPQRFHLLETIHLFVLPLDIAGEFDLQLDLVLYLRFRQVIQILLLRGGQRQAAEHVDGHAGPAEQVGQRALLPDADLLHRCQLLIDLGRCLDRDGIEQGDAPLQGAVASARNRS